MEGQNKNNDIVISGIIGNLGHILIVLIISGIMTLLSRFKGLSFYNITRLALLFLTYVFTLLFWFNIGIRSTRRVRSNFRLIGLVTAITTILPAGFFTILCHILSISTMNSTNLTKWNIFHLVGGPTLFWHRPFSFISEIFSGLSNGYTIFYINLLTVALLVFLGSIFFKKSTN